ncbi:uncharacterized protein LOC119729508 [Patiria miniata]|uniref:MADF domain-containing protein n=1 Tax=Patiria miniata TaxID=46514 RepID=A0A914A2Y2_PATMI|nr:uncharacterized protein LOC119729508 [Patiria miniata]
MHTQHSSTATAYVHYTSTTMELCVYESKEQHINSPDMAADNKAEATKYALDVQLISAVREFPLLYDPTARNYRDPEIVTDAWREIAKAIGANEWTECKERWRKLRDAYVKVKKSSTYQPIGNKKPITWVHYEDMSFLADHIKHRGNEKRGTKRSLDVEDEMQDASAAEALEEPQVGSSRRKDGKKGRKVPPSVDPMQVTIMEALAQGANTSKMPTDVILDDEEGLFGRMVAATLRRFPPRAKARCKFRIQEIIFQQENENLGGSV